MCSAKLGAYTYQILTWICQIILFHYLGDPPAQIDGSKEIDRSCSWDIIGTLTVSAAATIIDMGPRPEFLHVYTRDGITLCRKGALQARLKHQISAVQVGSGKISITYLTGGASTAVTSRLGIIGLDISKEHLLVWDGDEVRENLQPVQYLLIFCIQKL